jgi:hypothetical protein
MKKCGYEFQQARLSIEELKKSLWWDHLSKLGFTRQKKIIVKMTVIQKNSFNLVSGFEID